MRIILLGPPGAGKGTAARDLSKIYNIPHISTGDIFRDVASRDDELGKLVNETINKGFLIDDTLTNQIVNERLKRDDCINGYILDGYPRSINQAKEYDLINKDKQTIVIFLNLDQDEAIRRINGRLICKNCKVSYHKTTKELKPKQEGICDKCKGELIKRDDESEDTIKTRYQVYISTTKPLVDYYTKKGYLYTVDSSINPFTTLDQIVKIIDNHS